MASKKLWKAAPTQVLKVAKPIVHWGFVPLIVYIALKQDPSLTCVLHLLIFIRLSTISKSLFLYSVLLILCSLMQIINPFAAPAEQA